MLRLCITFYVFLMTSQVFAFTEPKCSKFDYEEKLLAKMIRMEMELEQLKLEMETHIKPKIEDLTTAVFPSTPTVAFSVYGPAKLDYSIDQIIVFKSVSLNEGSSYDTLTGVFKAQIKGLYYFNLHLCNKHKQFAHVAIVHDDKRIALTAQYEDHSSNCGSVSSLIKVDVGDNIYAISTHHTNIYESSHRRASFMGFLLHT